MGLSYESFFADIGNLLLADGLTADLRRPRLATPIFVCYFVVGKRSVRCLAADFILRFFCCEEGGSGLGYLASKAASSFTCEAKKSANSLELRQPSPSVSILRMIAVS